MNMKGADHAGQLGLQLARVGVGLKTRHRALQMTCSGSVAIFRKIQAGRIEWCEVGHLGED